MKKQLKPTLYILLFLIISSVTSVTLATPKEDYEKSSELTKSWLDSDGKLIKREINRLERTLDKVKKDNPKDIISIANVKSKIEKEQDKLKEVKEKIKTMQGDNKKEKIKIIEEMLKKEMSKLQKYFDKEVNKKDKDLNKIQKVNQHISRLKKLLEGAKTGAKEKDPNIIKKNSVIEGVNIKSTSDTKDSSKDILKESIDIKESINPKVKLY